MSVPHNILNIVVYCLRCPSIKLQSTRQRCSFYLRSTYAVSTQILTINTMVEDLISKLETLDPGPAAAEAGSSEDVLPSPEGEYRLPKRRLIALCVAYVGSGPF